jgi:hypothetical protein
VTDPSSFVLVSTSGLTSTVELRSASTGQLVQDVGTFGQSFTNNGLALSPDGRYVYVTFNAHQTLLLERIDVASGSRTLIADGEQPSLSPSGRLLAYATGPDGSETLVVRDLSSGVTRSVNLAKLLGPDTDLLNASITWLGDGSEIVIAPGGVASAVTTTEPASPGSCSAVASSATCLLVVGLTAGNSLTANRLVLSDLGSFNITIGGDDSLPRSVLIAISETDGTAVDRVDLSSAGVSVVRLLSLPPVLPLAFDPGGTHLLYLDGHSPPALWVGEITQHGLKRRHLLLSDAHVGSLAW